MRPRVVYVASFPGRFRLHIHGNEATYTTRGRITIHIPDPRPTVSIMGMNLAAPPYVSELVSCVAYGQVLEQLSPSRSSI